MDQDRFDGITRLFGAAASRRATIAGLAGLVAGAVPAVAGQVAAKPGRKRPRPEGPCGSGSRKDNICESDGDCCTGICNTATGAKNKDGKGRCRCIRRGKPCTEDKNCCSRQGVQMTCNSVAPVVASGNASADGEKVCGPAAPAGCSPATCAGGCCNGDICVPVAGQTSLICGTGGAACSPCSGSEACISGVCAATCVAEGLSCVGGQQCCAPFGCSGASLCCTTYGGACTIDAGCCQPLTGGAATCVSGTCCGTNGTACLNNSDCCSNNCDAFVCSV